MSWVDTMRRPETWLVLLLVIVDQITKAMVVSSIPLHETVPIIPSVLNLTHIQNTGAAFGLLNAVHFPYKSTIITVVALAALGAIALYALRFGSNTALGRVGLACVLGGALGNLVDRAARGYVVDFVDVYWGAVHFWAFNVADAAITVGAVALVLELLVGGHHVSEAV